MALRRPELSEALGENYPSTFNHMLRMFRSRGIPTDEAADLAQETATRLLGYLERRGGIIEDPMPLIHRIATNLVIDRSRSSDRRVIQLDPSEHDVPSAVDVGEEVASLHRRRAVRAAIKSLSPRQRDAIALTLDGLSPAEIADRLGLERNAADALLFRARKTLGERLKHMREEASSLGLVALVKLRGLARRGSSRPDAGQLAVVSPAFANAVSAIALAIGTFGSVPAIATTNIPASLTHRAPAVAATHGSTNAVATANGATAPRAVVLNVRDHRFHVKPTVHDPATGKNEPVGTDVWQSRDGSRRGVTGPALDDTTAIACSAKSLTAVCTSGA